jgi:hypothetical protein
MSDDPEFPGELLATPVLVIVNVPPPSAMAVGTTVLQEVVALVQRVLKVTPPSIEYWMSTPACAATGIATIPTVAASAAAVLFRRFILSSLRGLDRVGSA